MKNRRFLKQDGIELKESMDNLEKEFNHLRDK